MLGRKLQHNDHHEVVAGTCCCGHMYQPVMFFQTGEVLSMAVVDCRIARWEKSFVICLDESCNPPRTSSKWPDKNLRKLGRTTHPHSHRAAMTQAWSQVAAISLQTQMVPLIYLVLPVQL